MVTYTYYDHVVIKACIVVSGIIYGKHIILVEVHTYIYIYIEACSLSTSDYKYMDMISTNITFKQTLLIIL